MNLNLIVFIQEIIYLKLKDGTYVAYHDEFKSIEIYGIALYVNGNDIIYFDSLGFEHIPREI